MALLDETRGSTTTKHSCLTLRRIQSYIKSTSITTTYVYHLL